MDVSQADWIKYKDELAAISEKAAQNLETWLTWKGGYQNVSKKDLIDMAYALATRYGEATASLAAEMYDETAALSGVSVPSAEVADTASYGEIAKAINGVTKTVTTDSNLGNVVARYVKRAGADTTLKNAERDGAQFAWIPAGDTCAFCLTLASNGWQYQSKNAIKNGHASHIHANCDCTYAVRFDNKTNVKGYNPEKYKEMYYNAEGKTPQERINSMRRIHYQENRDKILAQKKANYEEKKLAQSKNNGIIQATSKGIGTDGAKSFKDKAERSKIINEAINAKEPIYADDLRKAYHTYGVQTKENLYDVVIHGSYKSVEYEHEYDMDAETLAYIISGRKDYKGDDIRLLSCSTGDADIYGDCFAQQLANILKVRVYAPIRALNINPNGVLTVGKKNLPEEQGFKWFEPR